MKWVNYLIIKKHFQPHVNPTADIRWMMRCKISGYLLNDVCNKTVIRRRRGRCKKADIRRKILLSAAPQFAPDDSA